MPGFTRTAGFWKNRPEVAEAVLDDVGGVTVCGVLITNVDVDDANSALEAMCVTPEGAQRLQLARQLTAAALNLAAGGAAYPGFAACNAVCVDAGATTMQISDCIDSADAYNKSFDQALLPFTVGNAEPDACKDAEDTACTVLSPADCATP